MITSWKLWWKRPEGLLFIMGVVLLAVSCFWGRHSFVLMWTKPRRGSNDAVLLRWAGGIYLAFWLLCLVIKRFFWLRALHWIHVMITLLAPVLIFLLIQVWARVYHVPLKRRGEEESVDGTEILFEALSVPVLLFLLAQITFVVNFIGGLVKMIVLRSRRA